MEIWKNAVRILRSRTVVAILVVAIFGSSGFAQLYTTFDDPSGYNTQIWGISGNTIVGSYSINPNNLGRRGFVYTGGVFSTIAGPSGSALVDARGVSGNNIVGYYGIPDSTGLISVVSGFLYDGNSYTTLNDPLATGVTKALGISGNTVVGNYSINGLSYGFIYNDGTYTTLVDPLADQTTGTVVQGISGTTVYGYYGDAASGGTDGFLYDNGTFTQFNANFPKSRDNSVEGISGNDIVGQYGIFGTNNYLYDGTNFSNLFILPGPITGISGNTVVGYYGNPINYYHGFIYTVPEPGSAMLCGLSLMALLARRRGIGA